MATTKLSAEMSARLGNLGISAKSEEDAKAKALKKLKEVDCEGFEDEDLDTMLSILENDTLKRDETNFTVQTESDEIGSGELKEYIAANANEVGDDEEPENEEPELSKKNVKTLPTNRKEAEKLAMKPAAKAEKSEPAPIKEAAKPASKATVPKWNPLENEADRGLFDIFEDFFPQDEFEWIWVKDGLTIKNKGVNGKKVVCYVTSSSSQMIKIWLPCLIGKTDILDERNLDYNDRNWNKTPIISQLTSDEAVEVMKSIKDDIMKVVLNIPQKPIKVSLPCL
jgi:hypothetical protein